VYDNTKATRGDKGIPTFFVENCHILITVYTTGLATKEKISFEVNPLVLAAFEIDYSNYISLW
jgi:hypothetical protein